MVLSLAACLPGGRYQGGVVVTEAPRRVLRVAIVRFFMSVAFLCSDSPRL